MTEPSPNVYNDPAVISRMLPWGQYVVSPKMASDTTLEESGQQ